MRFTRGIFLLAGALASSCGFPVLAQTPFEDSGRYFLPASVYAAGANPFGVASADFNADGKRDIVVANSDGDSVSILLGTGQGAFAAKIDYPSGDGAQTVAVADFNGDGKPDLAVAHLWAHTVSILTGTGTGAFSAPVAYPAGFNPRSVAVADLNGDGRADLAVPNGSSGDVSILLALAGGGFAGAVSYPTGGGAISVAIADFNGDAKLDLAVANEQVDTVSILLGAGNGSFGGATSVPVGDAPRAVAAADVDADGKLDLATANVDGNDISILKGAGNGTFSSRPALVAGARPTFVAFAELDGKSGPELVVVSEGSHTVSVLSGSPSGAFAAATPFAVGAQFPRAAAVADLDADGIPDLAVANAGGASVSVLLGHVMPPLDVAPSPDADAGSSYTLRKSSLWINRQVPGKPFSHASYADFDRDGRVDFVRTFGDNVDIRRPVQFMRNNGGGVFTDQTPAMLTTPQPGVTVTRKVLAGDYNGDGWPDVFILNHGLDILPPPGEHPQLFLSNGNGTLRYAGGEAFGPNFNHGGGSADLDGNGSIDILAINPEQPYLLLNDGSGILTRNTDRLPAEVADKPLYTGELIDIDLDGHIDIIAGGGEDQRLGTVIYWGNRSGTYRAARKTVLPPVTHWGVVLDYAAEDLDGDGARDLVINRTGSTQVYVGRYLQVLRQVAPRQFVDETASRITMDTSQPWFDYFRVQDINGDGWLDIFIDDKDFIPQGQYAWTNDGSGHFAPYTGPVVPSDAFNPLSIADASVAEGDSGSKLLSFTINLAHPATTAATVDVATGPGTALPGEDYIATQVDGIAFAIGQASATFQVPIAGDTQVEEHETFTANLVGSSGAPILRRQGLARIVNDDQALLSVDDVIVSEGSGGPATANFVVRLSRAMPNPVTFDIATSNGTAISGGDYVPRSQTARYLDAGRTSQAFSVTVLGDTLDEPNETFQVTIGNVVGTALGDGVAIGTIVDDDPAAASPANRPARGKPGRTTIRARATNSQ